ncbi:MAG: TIGR03936 family radical SAM-associated protein [Lachnospiraceae bacterium]|nr:TIGR03936 family radical SAM-associated protein [Lachnospiraceae bacterium]
MKIRIKFTKEEPVKYLGHLDIMRFFQRCFNRAGVMMQYSEGFNPHQKMSFAMPLGLGITSSGEYLDCFIEDGQNLEKIKEDMNKVSGDGFRVISIKELKEGAIKAMAAVAYASYDVSVCKEIPSEKVLEGAEAFLNTESYIVLKKTKKREQEVDIRPLVKELSARDNVIRMTLSAGSEDNVKAETVAKAVFDLMGIDYQREKITMNRLDLYAEGMIPLEDLDTISP